MLVTDETRLSLSWRLGRAQTWREGAPLTPPSPTGTALMGEIAESPDPPRLLAGVGAMCLSREVQGALVEGRAGQKAGSMLPRCTHSCPRGADAPGASVPILT